MNQFGISRVFPSEQTRYLTSSRVSSRCATPGERGSEEKKERKKSQALSPSFRPWYGVHQLAHIGRASPMGSFISALEKLNIARAAGLGKEGGATALTRARLVHFLFFQHLVAAPLPCLPLPTWPFPSQAKPKHSSVHMFTFPRIQAVLAQRLCMFLGVP